MAQPFFVTERISENQYETHEGFLVCVASPITRIGSMHYKAHEVPVTPGPSGDVLILRDEQEVFRPETIASAVGKPVTNDHPPVDVNPDNWKDLAIGHVLHPRRGEGEQHDLLVADLVITDRDAINLVKSGKKELSCGYDVDYEELSPGVGRHFNIVVNHVALVDEGRCGPRCAILDAKPEMVRTQADINSDAYRRLNERTGPMPSYDKMTLDELKGMGSTEGELHPTEADSHIHVHIPGGASVAGDSIGHHMGSEGHHGGHFGRIKKKGPGHDRGRKRHRDAEEEPDFHERLSHLEDSVHHMHGMIKDLHRGRHGSHDNEEEYEKYEESEEEDDCYDSFRPRHRHRDEEEPEGEKVPEKERSHPVEGKLEFEAPEGTGDRRHRGKDRRRGDRDRRPGRSRDSYTRDAVDNMYQDTIAMAEILVPGIRVPTYDSVCADPAGALCAFRKKVLDIASSQEGTAHIVENIAGDGSFTASTLSCRDAAMMFKAVATARAASNNGGVRRTTDIFAEHGTGGGLGIRSKLKTPADVNARNREFYAKATGVA